MRKLLLIFLLAYFNVSAQPPMRSLLGKHASASLLLDLYPTASRAYSLRKLRTAYSGNAILVRRSSDNTTSGIGFLPSGHLDTSSLKTFVGANDGFVRIWYDQSGNGINAEQTTTNSEQPKIVSSGTIERIGGMPAMIFVPASSTNLRFTSITSNSDWSCYMVQKRRATSVRGPMFSRAGGTSGGPLFAQWNDNNFYIQRVSTVPSGFYRGAADATATFSLLEAYNISSVISGYKNATAYTLGTQLTFVATEDYFNALGKYGSGFSDGHFLEVVFYASDKSSDRTGIESNINTYYTIY
jgi:hypothetical protein